MPYCPHCGIEVSSQIVFCGNCGTQLQAQEDRETAAVSSPGRGFVQNGGRKKHFIVLGLGVVVAIAVCIALVFGLGKSAPDKESVLKVGDLYAMSSSELFDYYEALDYEFLDEKTFESFMTDGDTLDQMTIMQLVQAQKYGNTWLSKSLYDLLGVSESDENAAYIQNTLQSVLVNDCMVTVALYGADYIDEIYSRTSKGDSSQYLSWCVNSRMDKEALQSGKEVREVQIFLQESPFSVSELGRETPAERVQLVQNRMTALLESTNLDAPLAVETYEKDYGDPDSQRYYLCVAYGITNVKGKECFYYCNWQMQAGSEGKMDGYISICSLEDACKKYNVADLEGLTKRITQNNSNYTPVEYVLDIPSNLSGWTQKLDSKWYIGDGQYGLGYLTIVSDGNDHFVFEVCSCSDNWRPQGDVVSKRIGPSTMRPGCSIWISAGADKATEQDLEKYAPWVKIL